MTLDEMTRQALSLSPSAAARSAGVTPQGLQIALEEKLLEFFQILRLKGFILGTQESLDAFKVADIFLCTDFACFHWGLRSLCCTSQTQYEEFDALFNRFWRPRDGTEHIRLDQFYQAERKKVEGQGLLQTTGYSETVAHEGETPGISGASTLESLLSVDFSQVPPARQHDLEQLADRLWRRSRLNRPRRLRGQKWKRTLNFRKTLRQCLAHGGELNELILTGRKPRKPNLVVLLDVSGSMELYSFLFLRLLFALHRKFRRMASFVFNTRLEEITEALKARSIEAAMSRLTGRRLGWNGGTEIGLNLRQLVASEPHRLFRPDTVFVILSDGLDVGPPEVLAEALREIQHRCRKVLWLNPLLGIEGYQPIAQGMQAALPFIDAFLPAHNLESLMDIERHLL